jgi:ADP-dependent glucokinase
VSGLQMLDNFPFPKPSTRSDRIRKVMQQIHSVKKSTLIHFEMASYVQLELMEDLQRHILPYVDSIGCNEQEIDNLMNFLENGRISYSSDSNPRVASTLDQARRVFKHLNENYFLRKDEDKNLRLLSRIHIHTLAFQLIFNARESRWKNIRSSVAKSVLTAHRHVCQTTYVNPENSMLILDDSFATSMTDESDFERPKRIEIKKKTPISCWSEKMAIGGNLLDVKICIAPNMVCKDAKKTAGAGDMISASGLAAQI